MPERSAREIAARMNTGIYSCCHPRCARCEELMVAAIEQRDAEHMAGYRELAAREIQLRAEHEAEKKEILDKCFAFEEYDGREATRAQLRAENARLRESLETIARRWQPSCVDKKERLHRSCCPLSRASEGSG